MYNKLKEYKFHRVLFGLYKLISFIQFSTPSKKPFNLLLLEIIIYYCAIIVLHDLAEQMSSSVKLHFAKIIIEGSTKQRRFGVSKFDYIFPPHHAVNLSI